MASVTLKNWVKHSALFYSLYYYLGSLFVYVLRCFTRPDDHLILFVSYGGKYYDDSPKDIYEAMLKDERYDAYNLIWAFTNPDTPIKGRGKKIRIDSLQYYKTALRARVWVTNVSITRGLFFKGIHTFSINSWHGTAIKKIGEDSITKDSFKSKYHGRRADVMLAQSKYDKTIYSKAFKVPINDVILTGFPRNDSLVSDNRPEKIQLIKKKLSLPINKKVILYAPTYRDYDIGEGNECFMQPHLDLEKWKKWFGGEYVLAIRAHMAVSKVMGIKDDEFIRDFSGYPSLNDLLLVTDILISDYSGILFDYSILGRPIMCFTYDYELYREKRGLYIDIREELYSVGDEESLINSICHMDKMKMCEGTLRFRDKYVQEYGHASQNVIDLIYKRIAD